MMNKCLAGWNIVLTQTSLEGKNLPAIIANLGGEPIPLPLITIEPLPVNYPPDSFEYDYIFFPSYYAVNCTPFNIWETLKNHPTRIFTMGEHTSLAVINRGAKVFFTAPPNSTSESVLKNDFLKVGTIDGKRILIISGERRRLVMETTLKARGALVEVMVVYNQKNALANFSDYIEAWLTSKRQFCFVITSLQGFENLYQVITPKDRKWFADQWWIGVSERIILAIQNKGFNNIVLAQGPNETALQKALVYLGTTFLVR